MVTSPFPQRGLIDTPLLVAYRNGEPDAVRFVTAVQSVRRPECSQISSLVLLSLCQDALDVVGVQALLAMTDVRAVTAHTTRRAQHLLETLPPPCGLAPDDAIVAATAIEHSLPLYTLDPARFANLPGLVAIKPY